MQLIECPWCGPREETEFHYGGQAHIPYPADPAALSDEEWARYIFFRDNTKGLWAERWSHSHGCRRWFNALRDTATYRFQTRLPSRRSQAGDHVTNASAPTDFRAPEGGRIDRSTTIGFTFNGEHLTGHPGDTLASALLADRSAPDHQQHQAGPTAWHLRRLGRGPLRTGADRTALPRTDGAGHHHRAVRRARRTRHSRTGPAQRRPRPCPLRRHASPRRRARHRGRADRADRRAQRSQSRGPGCADRRAVRGRRVVAVRGPKQSTASPPTSGCPTAVAELAGQPEVLHLQRTTAFGSYDDGFVLALERRTDHLGERHRRAFRGNGSGDSAPHPS